MLITGPLHFKQTDADDGGLRVIVICLV